MPSRPWTLVICCLWLAANGWLVYHDLWPRLFPGDAPPYAIDLIDEARRSPLPIRWGVWLHDERQGRDRRVGSARTWVAYQQEDDTFALHSEITQLELGRSNLLPVVVNIEKMTNVYRIARDEVRPGAGELRGISADINLVLLGHGPPLQGLRVPARATLSGEVREGQFHPRGTVEALGKSQALPLEPVPLPKHGTLLNPLHPVNRVTGLRSGQRWRVPLVDPLSDSVNQAVAHVLPLKQAAKVLDAEVLPESELLDWDGGRHVCRVIEYRGEEERGRTWVRVLDDLVLRQELEAEGRRMTLIRE